MGDIIMLEKTIQSVLNRKFKQWVKSISDEEVRKAVEKNTIITGGCIVSLMLNEEPQDYDIYFRDKETLLKVAKYYAKQFNDQHLEGINRLGKSARCFVLDGASIERRDNGTFVLYDDQIGSQIKGFQQCISTTRPEHGWILPDGGGSVDARGFSRMIANCEPDRIKMIIMSDGVAGDLPNNEAELIPEKIIEGLDECDAKTGEGEQADKGKYHPVYITTNAVTLSDGIQIIVRFYGEPEEIHKNYDYEHTKGYWTSWENVLVIPKSVYECVMNKTLKYTGSKYPLCSIFRMRKFIERGWHINAGQILKMAFQVSELDLHNVDVLEDQLVGVDTVYFQALIHDLKQAQETNSNFVVDSHYVMSVVDKIF